MKTSNTTRKATATVIEYRTADFAIVTNWQNPFTAGIHGDWRKQVRVALSKPEYHTKLAEKLAKFTPFVIFYTKLAFDKSEILDLVQFADATIAVICSSGEHLLTPWMIIHNIGHALVSLNVWVKRQIMEVIGLTSHNDSITDRQRDLVNTQASRKGLIPNINELIYELYTTWVWHGHTQSNNQALRSYCDNVFPQLMAKYRNQMFAHKYRHPVKLATPQPWLQEMLMDLPDDQKNYVPGVPGFTTKVLKRTSLSSAE